MPLQPRYRGDYTTLPNIGVERVLKLSEHLIFGHGSPSLNMGKQSDAKAYTVLIYAYIALYYLNMDVYESINAYITCMPSYGPLRGLYVGVSIKSATATMRQMDAC